ncbi:perforin-1-like [Discoglossus pictus]
MLLPISLLLFVSYSSPAIPPPLTSECKVGTMDECKKASFVPGHTILGEGINIVTMEKTGAFLLDLQKYGNDDKTCILCKNPHKKDVWEKLPKYMVDWKPQSVCSRSIISSISRSYVQLAEESTSSVNNDWRVGLEIQHAVVEGSMAVAGSHSKMAKFAYEKSLIDNYNFLNHKLECTFYSFRLSAQPELTPDFATSLQQLPASYNQTTKEEYKKLINTYGTHYITRAEAGGTAQEITAVRTCEVAMDGLTIDEVKDCLSVEATISAQIPIENANISSKFNWCRKYFQNANDEDSFHQKFSERLWLVKGGKATIDILSTNSNTPESYAAFTAWMESINTLPDLVDYSLEPIHNLIRFKGPQKDNLKTAVSEYINEKALIKSCSCSGNSHPSHKGDCSCFCNHDKYMNSDCCPTNKGLATVVFTIKSAEGLYGDFFTKSDAYVKITFNSFKAQTTMVKNNNNPTWNEYLKLGTQMISETRRYKIEVWDDDKTDDDLLGKCVKPLKSETDEICYLDHGSITYSINVTCATHLRGVYCQDYNPVPPI